MPFSLSGPNTVLFALAARPHRAQQFQKNAYHNDKCVISEPVYCFPSSRPLSFLEIVSKQGNKHLFHILLIIVLLQV
jgi:hypothetical protein